VLELLEILQFQLPESHNDLSQSLHALKDDLKVDEILGNSATVEHGGVYHLSERGDRLIDLSAFRDLLWQEYKRLEVQFNLLVNGQKQAELREAVQQLLRWAWKRNRNLEEQAAQLHMLVGWSQLVEVSSISLSLCSSLLRNSFFYPLSLSVCFCCLLFVRNSS
jgi:nuclear pore complex protein Nup205